MTGWQLVRVVWHDAHGATSGWTHHGDIDPAPAEIQTVGWLVPNVKPGHLVVVQSIDPHGNVDNAIAIPTSMVREVLQLSSVALLPVESQLVA
jgi:hypothetical protein